MYISSTVKDILYSLVVAALFLLFKGFIFNTADQIEPLVLVYKNLDPSLYTNDLYVHYAKDIFTVRYFYVQLLTFLGVYFDLYDISLIFCYLCLFFSTLGLIKISKLITQNNVTGYFVPFFVLFLFLSWTVGGNVLQYHLFIGSSVAKATAIWGLYFLLKKKYVLSGFLIGIGGLFQVLVGLQLGIIILFALILAKKFKASLKWGIFWLLSISPMLIPIIYRQFFSELVEFQDEDFYKTLYEIRNPQHYLPHLFSKLSYLKLIFICVVGYAFLYISLQREVFEKILRFSIIILFGILLYTVFIDVFGVMAIGKIQWFKTTIWLSAIAAMGIGIGIEYLLKRWLDAPKMMYSSIIVTLLYIAYVNRDTQIFQLDRTSAKDLELQRMHHWIRDNTHKDAIFATYIDDEYFLCEAKRSLVVNWNAIIHESWFLSEWSFELFKLYGYDIENIKDPIKFKKKANKNYEMLDWAEGTYAQYCIMRNEVSLYYLDSAAIRFKTENYKLVDLSDFYGGYGVNTREFSWTTE